MANLEEYHNENGKFRKGNKGGPGNPWPGVVARMREAFRRQLTKQQCSRLVAALIREAEGGNIEALKEVMNRVLGKSVQPIEVAGSDEKTVALLNLTSEHLARLESIALRQAQAATLLLEGGKQRAIIDAGEIKIIDAQSAKQGKDAAK